MLTLVKNVGSNKLYFTEKVGKNELIVSWQECQRLETFVAWCVYNDLEPKNAASLEKFASMLSEERQFVIL